MSSLEPIFIAGYSEGSGYETDKKPFLLPDQAFPVLENAYVYRERVKKREGNEKLGRLRRVYDDASLGNSAASPWNFNIFTFFGINVSNSANPQYQPNAEIECGSVVININPVITTGAITNIEKAINTRVTSPGHGLTTGDLISISGVLGIPAINGGPYLVRVSGADVFRLIDVNSLNMPGTYIPSGIWTYVQPQLIDQGDGTLVTVPASGTSGTINYITGAVTITGGAAGAPTIIDFNYFPSLPAMGIWTRDLSSVNDEQTVFFDTTYAYVWVGSGFQEWIPGTTWSGSDSDFFLATNYRGIEPSDRLMFVTNFVNNASNPMRYTDGNTWTDFTPILGSITKNDSLGTLIAPWTTFAGNLSVVPFISGTVVITAGTVTFNDENEDGTLTGSPNTNTGTIDYTTGAIVLNFSPALTADTPISATYQVASTYLFQARILIPYYGRLLALNTWEGESLGSSQNIYNRCRFSRIGSPVLEDSWLSSIPGKGGFIDAPTAEEIISATFFKNTLIVFFERSTWQLRYVGEYGLPFIWERISSDFGSESTFSPILFDDGIFAVGDKAIVTSSGTNVVRIDEKIPNLVFTFRNANAGVQRVHGARNFQKELAFWCYPDSDDQEVDEDENQQKFPNKVLIANYRNKTFAILRDNITCFGTFQSNGDLTWDSFDAYWDSQDIFWNDVDSQSGFPNVVCGNQQGYISYYLKQDNTAINQESLSIRAVDLSVTPITLTVINHNLLTGDIILLSGLHFVDASKVPVTTDLNDRIFQAKFVDLDTISLSEWDGSIYAENFSFTPTSADTYIGCGEITLLPKMTIQTKDFNPYQAKGSQLKLSYVDFLTDATPESSEIAVNLYINSAINQAANLIVGNRQVENNLPAPYYPPGLTSEYAWHRFFATSTGQYMRIELTYNDALMNLIETHQSTFVLNAMCLWIRPGSRTIF